MKRDKMLLQSLLLLAALQGSAQEPSFPVMYLNANEILNPFEVVLTARVGFTLRCHGNGSTAPVHWSSTAFKLRSRGDLTDRLTIKKAETRHTGTYSCQYNEEELRHLKSMIHIYVKDPDNPANIFVTPLRTYLTIKEGQDLQFECLLIDPSVTDLALRRDRGEGGLPEGMNVTLDAHRGALIRQLKPSYSGAYVCSGRRDGREYTSSPVSICVLPKIHFPPTVSISRKKYVRIVGEKLDVTCITINDNHFFNITWKHSDAQITKELNISTSHKNSNPVNINSTVSISAVSHQHNGTLTCTAINEAGSTTRFATVRVVDGPYLKVYLKPMKGVNMSTSQVKVNGEQLVNVSAHGAEASRERNPEMKNDTVEVHGIRPSSYLVEVYEGQDVTLTFVIEAYPPILRQWWMTSTHQNISDHQENHDDRYESSLLVRKVRAEDRMRYIFHYASLHYNGSQEVDLRIYQSPNVFLTLENNTLTCHGTGYPLPTILWYICPGVTDTCGNNGNYEVPSNNVTRTVREEEEEKEEVQKQLTLPSTIDESVSIECVAYNHVGTSRDLYVFHLPAYSKGSTTPFVSATLVGVSSIAALFLLLLLVVLYKYKQKPKYEIRWKIIESNHGNNYSFIDPTHLPYNQKWEFPRERLRLGAVLGAGAFGKVVEATAYGLGTEDNVTRVAVKMLKSRAHSEEREALMSELKILSHLGYHDNIVNLLGACTRGGPMLMITEYCSHGDLLNFLRGQAQAFLEAILNVADGQSEQELYKNVAAQHVRVRSDSGISCCSDQYQTMHPALPSDQSSAPKGSVCDHSQTDSLFLDIGDLLIISYQVAQGMEFLASRNCIHRDVAARNVLLTDQRVAKICDFGLARDIMNDDNYIVKGNARLPVKWMAPESIFDCMYTVQSDVWSYGILLWEIFSLGKSPYPNIVVDTNFYKMIKDGCQMIQPDFAPPEMYHLMKQCWNLEPTERPTFNTIGQLIKQLLSQANCLLSHQTSEANIQAIQGQEVWIDGEQEEGRGEEQEVLKDGDDDDDEELEVEQEPLMMTRMIKKIPNIYHQC